MKRITWTLTVWGSGIRVMGVSPSELSKSRMGDRHVERIAWTLTVWGSGIRVMG